MDLEISILQLHISTCGLDRYFIPCQHVSVELILVVLSPNFSCSLLMEGRYMFYLLDVSASFRATVKWGSIF